MRRSIFYVVLQFVCMYKYLLDVWLTFNSDMYIGDLETVNWNQHLLRQEVQENLKNAA